MKKRKLQTKLEFYFEEQEDFPEFDVDMKIKTRKKNRHTKIKEHKHKRKNIKDASTELF